MWFTIESSLLLLISKDEWYKGNEWYEFNNIQNTSILDATELGQEESVKRVLVKSKE